MKRIFTALMLLFFLPGLLTFPAAARAASPGHSTFDQLDAYLEKQVQAAHIPGLAIGVVQGDQIVHLQGYGKAGPDGRAVTPQTPFLLGSVSKGITALAAMQLVEAGQLDLDAPVKNYLPWFAGQEITIRHLLNQTSGITTRAGRSMLADNYQGSDAIQRYARKMSAEPRQRQPGEQYQYSNANYVILGAIIEAVSGQAYQDYLREHVFQPLGMVHSYASLQAAAAEQIATGHSQVFGLPIPFQGPYPAGNVPCGYLITSAEDMTHYLAAQLNEGVYQGKQIVAADAIATLHTGKAAVSTTTSYAMGWIAGEVEGLKALYHTGELPNYQSIVILLPEQKLGLVILVNEYSAFNNQQISHLAWDAAHILVGQEPVVLQSEPMMFVVVGIVAVIDLFTILLLWWSFRVWRSERSSRTVPKHRGQIAAPALLLAAVAAFSLAGFPYLFETPIPGMLLFAPELAWAVVLAGAAAAIGCAAFPLLLLFGSKK